MKPLISIIVIAHDRRKFLKYALASISNQTTNKELYEVLVVKNFEDDEIDAYSKEHAFKSVITSAASASDKIMVGYNHATGDIIGFLEDDDLYYPNRIERVLNVFQTYKRLWYYHNEHKVIGKNYEQNLTANSESEKLTAEGLTIIRNMPDYITLHHLVRRRVDFNISSICIRKEALKWALSTFGGNFFGTDMYLFFTSTVSHYEIGIDNTKLTKYRVHEENASHVSYAGGNKDVFIEKRINLFNKMNAWRQEFLQKLRKVNNHGDIVKFIEFQMQFYKLDIYFISGNYSRKELFEVFVDHTKNCPISDVRLLSSTIFFSLFSFYNKRISHLLYFALYFKIVALK